MLTIIQHQRGELTRNDEIRRELTAIATSRRGLTPKTLLDVAKSPKSTLHCYFEWDDTEAAQKYREYQAYELIRRVKVKVETPDHNYITVRAFWPVRQVEKDGTVNLNRPGVYLPLTDALQDEQALEQILEAAKSELKAFSIKYRQLSAVAEMSEVFEAIEELV